MKQVLLVIYNFLDSSVYITVSNFLQLLDPYYDVRFIQVNKLNRQIIKNSHVCIFVRCFHSQLSMKATQLGKTVIYIIDDHLLGIYENGPEYKEYAPGTLFYGEVEKHLLSADMVFTYSPQLTQVVLNYTSKITEMKTSIQQLYLDRKVNPIQTNMPIRLIYAGGSYRTTEFEALWPAFKRFSQSKGNLIEFHFWGLEISHLSLHSPTFFQPFSYNYFEYLNLLYNGNFHIMICPLLDHIRARKTKAPIKYLESTAAGCIGIYSDIEIYKNIINGTTGIKTGNTVNGWTHALETAYQLGNIERKRIWQKARDDISVHYTVESQVKHFLKGIDQAKKNASLRN